MQATAAMAAPRKTGAFAKVYSVLGVLVLIEILAQFFFIAAAMLPVAGSANNDGSLPAAGVALWKSNYEMFAMLHGLNGMFIIPVTTLLLLIVSFAARHTWRTTLLTLGLFGLLVLQFALALIAFGNVAVVGGLHGLNAIAILTLAGYLTRSRWAF